MSAFISQRRTKTRRQVNNAPPQLVFPLLCPVREKDWIDGWDYRMIYSDSGVAEQGCVFTTSAEGRLTTWYVTAYAPERFFIEFVRITPGEMAVRLSVQLTDNENGSTTSDIVYEYTALSEEANRWLAEKLDESFDASMRYWEAAINHYLLTGKKLPRH